VLQPALGALIAAHGRLIGPCHFSAAGPFPDNYQRLNFSRAPQHKEQENSVKVFTSQIGSDSRRKPFL
jgi:hypothetical protein